MSKQNKSRPVPENQSRVAHSHVSFSATELSHFDRNRGDQWAFAFRLTAICGNVVSLNESHIGASWN